MIAVVVWSAALAGAVTLTAFWQCSIRLRGRPVSQGTVRWAYRLFILHWIALVPAPLCYTAGFFLFSSEAAGYVYSYNTLIFWAALAMAAALINCGIMAYALAGTYRSQPRGLSQSGADHQYFHLDDSCRHVFCAALLTYLLLLPEVYLILLVTLFTGCASCMWEGGSSL